jgi:2'-5' RNA ligase
LQYFIGIVPSDEYKIKLIEFQQRWENNRITDVVEPHITLKAQGGLTPDEDWLSKVREVCQNFKPFQITLDQPMFFGTDILYLSANSKELIELHRRIVQAVSPSKDLIQKYFELDDYVPHLTIGKTTYGLSKLELIDMKELAEKKLSPFPTFDVRFVRVYQEIETNKYIKYIDFPLNCLS